MNTFALRTGFIALLTCGAAACSSAIPPQELVNARTEYDKANNGMAAQLDPADLHSAKVMLNAAERSFNDKGDVQETRDLSYAALRTVQVAEARARTKDAVGERDRTLAELHSAEEAALQGSSAALAQSKERLAAQGVQLDNERARREAAERRAAHAADALARIAAVKQDTRGMVLTLSGSVLFVTNKADLLSTARTKLDEVAKVLTQDYTDGSKIVVEGYTDSRGSQQLNDALSQRRAESVRDYLISRGVPADRIGAVGKGPANPVADNNSAEGRADNRRVEIVVQNGQ